MARYTVHHSNAKRFFIVDNERSLLVAEGFDTRGAAEDYIATALAPEPEPTKPTWTIVRDEDGMPVRMER